MAILDTDTTDCCSPPPPAYPADRLDPQQRCHLALHALAGTHTITPLADLHQVSRKFVYQVADTADRALHHAFDPAPDDQVLFDLPVGAAPPLPTPTPQTPPPTQPPASTPTPTPTVPQATTTPTSTRTPTATPTPGSGKKTRTPTPTPYRRGGLPA